MKASLLISGTLVTFASGCTIARIVNHPTPEFGDFAPGQRYVLKTDAIITDDHKNHFQLPSLVVPETVAATNWVRGKVRGVIKATPVKEKGRLPAGTVLEFVGIGVVKDELNPPENTGPIMKVVEDVTNDLTVHAVHLCHDGRLWGNGSNPVFDEKATKIIGSSFSPWPEYLVRLDLP